MCCCPRWLMYAGFFAVTILAYVWRLPRGLDLGDESYYANFYVAWLRAPILDTGDLSAHQPSHLLVYPLVRAYAWLVPDLTGLILYLRVIYAVICIGTATLVLVALRGLVSTWTAIGVAATTIVFIPFALPAPSYNTLALLMSVCGASCFLRAMVSADPASSRRWFVAGGPFFALQTLSYPTLVVVPFGIWLGCYLVARRDRSRALWAGLAALLAGHAAIALTVVGVFTTDRLAAMLDFTSAYGVNFSVEKKVALALKQLRENSAFLPICAAGLLLSLLRSFGARISWVRWGHAVGTIALLYLLVVDAKPTLDFRSHGVVLFLCIAGSPILRHIFRSNATREERFSAIWYAMSIVGGTVTSWTSNNALMNFPIGAFGAIPAVVLDWSRPGNPASGSRAGSISTVAVLVALASGSVTRFYGEIPGSPLPATVPSGPFAGLRTTPDRLRWVADLRERLSHLNDEPGRENDRVSVFGDFPGLYLLTPFRMSTPHSWPLPFGLDGLQPILGRYYSDPHNLPETILLYGTPANIHSVQKGVLTREYVIDSEQDAPRVYRRSDLQTSSARPLLAEWDTGFWPEESDASGRWRWAIAQSQLELHQFSQQPKRCRLHAVCYAYDGAAATLTVTGPGLERKFPIDATRRDIDLDLMLPPGHSTIRWTCDAKPLVHPSRTIVFCLHGYKIELDEK